MHSSGFDDAANELLTIEAPPARAVGPARPGGDHPDLVGRMDHWQSRMTILRVFVAMFFLLSVGAVCADAPAPMDKEIGGHGIEEEHRFIDMKKGDGK
jgi:hypothetical protein